MMTISLRLVGGLLLAIAVVCHPKPFKNRHILEKDMLSQDEIERTVRRIEEGEGDESAELIEIEENQDEDRKVLTMKSNKRDIKLDLEPAYGLIRPDIRVVTIDNDGETETDLPASLRFGLYRGSVTGSHSGMAALMKNEEGWHGLVSSKDHHFHLHGLKTSARSLLVHLPKESDGENLGDTESLADDDSLGINLVELTEERNVNTLTEDDIFKRALSKELKLEVGITTDADVLAKVQKRYPKADAVAKVKEMVLNTVNGIQAYFLASKMDYEIKLEIAAIHILKVLPKEIADKGGKFFAYEFFCGWDADNNNPNRVNYDMGLFFTGNRRNGAGVAPLGRACQGRSSCAHAQLTSYAGASIMTHEIGHNLNAPHDTADDNPSTNCGSVYIMWFSTSAASNSFSSCSNKHISKYIKSLDDRNINCMRTDSKTSIKLCPSTLLPGKYLEPNKQCHIIYGEGTVDMMDRGEYCKMLGCRKGWLGYYPYMGAPLPGSRCGKPDETKICWQDECLDEAAVYEKIKELYKGRKQDSSTCPLPDFDSKPTPNKCGPGWDRLGDYCYKLLSKEGTQKQGQKACKELGGGSDLASISNQKEADFTYRFDFGAFYIGLKDESYTSDEGTDVKRDWKWPDGTPLNDFAKWGKDEPDNSGGSQKCVEVSYGLVWSDVSCNENLKPLCKKPVVAPPPSPTTPPPVNPCGKDWEQFGENCYQMTKKAGTEKEGEAACQALGVASHLVSILDKNEGDFVRAKFYEESFFIGLEDKSYTTEQGSNVQRYWKWTDGSPVSYTAWARWEPNNWAGSEKCTQILDGHKWNDISCDSKYLSLCKKPLNPPPTKPKPPPVNPCGEGWKEHLGFCYQMITEEGTQLEGEAACKGLSEGSHLASILSREESDFVRFIFKSTSKFFIGLKDVSGTKERGKQAKRDWRWLDGSKYEFKRWSYWEPNNYGGEEACTMILNKFRWNDISCDTKYPALCKKPVGK